MLLLEQLFSWMGFVLVSLVVCVSPWFFGAWEMWWFWTFALVIFLATACFGIRCLIWGALQHEGRHFHRGILEITEEAEDQFVARRMPRGVAWLLLCYLLFLFYAMIRMYQADVYMDAERSFLRFLTPFLLGIQIAWGFNSRQRTVLWVLILCNFCLLGAYGIANYYVTGNEWVLWRPGYEQYQMGVRRATGSYFCPDHFSGLMELAVCAGLGLLLAREKGWPWKLWGMAILLTGLAGVVLSKSRGGGMAVAVVLVAALVWGFGQWPVLARWYYRFCGIAVLAIGLLIFWKTGGNYVDRFMAEDGWGSTSVQVDKHAPAWKKTLARVETTSRGRMIGGALRAWETRKLWGIGPGMHQNLWPRFAATGDGDRELGAWPRQSNTDFHSYEVHSDWVQLLEEYGAFGLGVFLVPAGAIFGVLMMGLYRESRARRGNEWSETDREDHAILLAGVLGYAAMAFHSLGDFNLQIPGTVWLFGTMLSLALAHATRLRSVTLEEYEY